MQFTRPKWFEPEEGARGDARRVRTTPYANGCLLARRLVESGRALCTSALRARGSRGDDHINKNLKERCPRWTAPRRRLIRDYKKRRGLLDSTLVVWGRRVRANARLRKAADGRDHNPYGFTMWMAGGGVKAGQMYGSTDEFGFKAVDKQVSTHDLHATVPAAHGAGSREADLPLWRAGILD